MQLTYYVAPWDQADDTPDTPEHMADRTDGLRWGYMAADIDRCARMAVRRKVGGSFHPAESYEIAWSAIALELYSRHDPPTQSDLVRAGWEAIADAMHTDARHHGMDIIRHKGSLRPKYLMFWDDVIRPAPSPENAVVERLALDQIWPALTVGQQEALAALAMFGTATTAAEAIGKNHSAFHQIARHGRIRFRKLWHEGESLPPTWGRDTRGSEGADYRQARAAIKRGRKRAGSC